jgi:hypothetical protein
MSACRGVVASVQRAGTIAASLYRQIVRVKEYGLRRSAVVTLLVVTLSSNDEQVKTLQNQHSFLPHKKLPNTRLPRL